MLDSGLDIYDFLPPEEPTGASAPVPEPVPAHVPTGARPRPYTPVYEPEPQEPQPSLEQAPTQSPDTLTAEHGTEGHETEREKAEQLAFRPELFAQAQQLYNMGWTVLASQYKAPRCFAWKAPTPAECYTKTLQAINAGRANSLNFRLDNDLAALDLDFRDERLTAALVDAYQDILGGLVPYTVRGKKGGKIFFRLENKENSLKLKYIGADCYPPDTDFAQPEQVQAKRCELELKTDVATVYGYHSPGLRYSAIPGTQSVLSIGPQELPVLDIGMLEAVYKQAQITAGFVPLGGLKVTPAEMGRARVVMAYAKGLHGIGADDFAAVLLRFLAYTGHEFERQAAQMALGIEQSASPYQAQLKRLQALPPIDEDGAAIAFDRLYAKEREGIACRLGLAQAQGYQWAEAQQHMPTLCAYWRLELMTGGYDPEQIEGA